MQTTSHSPHFVKEVKQNEEKSGSQYFLTHPSSNTLLIWMRQKQGLKHVTFAI